MQLDQSPTKTVPEIHHLLILEHVLEETRKLVSLILAVPATGVHGDAEHGLEGHKDHLHKSSEVRSRRKRSALWRTWKRMKAMSVGGWAATCFGKPNERRKGGAWRNAGKSARMVKMCNCDMQRRTVGCM